MKLFFLSEAVDYQDAAHCLWSHTGTGGEAGSAWTDISAAFEHPWGGPGAGLTGATVNNTWGRGAIVWLLLMDGA